MFLLENIQLEVDTAKAQSLKTTKAAINSWYQDLNICKVLLIYNDTASK